jgi:hypothetical protein
MSRYCVWQRPEVSVLMVPCILWCLMIWILSTLHIILLAGVPKVTRTTDTLLNVDADSSFGDVIFGLRLLLCFAQPHLVSHHVVCQTSDDIKTSWILT